MAAKYHTVETVADSTTVTLNATDYPQMTQCTRHELDVDGTVTIETRKSGRSTYTNQGSLTDETKIIDSTNVDSIKITNSSGSAAEIAVTGDEER